MYDIEIYQDIHGNSDILVYFKSLTNINSKDNRIKANKLLKDYKNRSENYE